MSATHFGGKILVLAICIVSTVQGTPMVCQDDAVLSPTTNLCECEGELFYNAAQGRCMAICEYYGDRLCGYYANQMCEQDGSNAIAFSCSCPDGFENDGYGMCIDFDECEVDSVSCNGTVDHEICVNLVGASSCKCAQGYYRDQDEVCREIDLCNQPNEYACDQVCSHDENGTGKCSCFSGFALVDGECVMDGDYETCECGSNPEYAICLHYSIEKTTTCQPKPGFEPVPGSEEEMQDINECQKVYECPFMTTCANTIGSYTCECMENYTWNEDMEECVPPFCSDGHILFNSDCKDPCDEALGQICPRNTRCVVGQNNVASCGCQLQCQMDGQPTNSTFSIYAVGFHMPYETYHQGLSRWKYEITYSLESIFGIGNAEIHELATSKTGNDVTIKIGVEKLFPSVEDLTSLLKEYCWPLEASTFEPKCIFPSGIIVDIVSIDVFIGDDPCIANPNICDSPNTVCISNNSIVDSIMPGTFRCLCGQGFDYAPEVDSHTCIDINECQGSDGLCEEGHVCQDLTGGYTCLYADDEIESLENQINDANEEIIVLNSEIGSINEEIEEVKQKSKVLGGVFGGMLSVGLLVIAISSAYIYYIKFMKGKEDKYSNEERDSKEME